MSIVSENFRDLQQERKLCGSDVLNVHVDLERKQEGEEELVLLIEAPV